MRADGGGRAGEGGEGWRAGELHTRLSTVWMHAQFTGPQMDPRWIPAVSVPALPLPSACLVPTGTGRGDRHQSRSRLPTACPTCLYAALRGAATARAYVTPRKATTKSTCEADAPVHHAWVDDKELGRHRRGAFLWEDRSGWRGWAEDEHTECRLSE